jgi:hypothetical protein
MYLVLDNLLFDRNALVNIRCSAYLGAYTLYEVCSRFLLMTLKKSIIGIHILLLKKILNIVNILTINLLCKLKKLTQSGEKETGIHV